MSAKKATVKKGSSGMAFDVILKPAASDIPQTPRGMKPGSQGQKAPNISKKDIDKKLKEAEQQRKARDLERQERLKKHVRFNSFP